ncbi:MAG: hypothetical protein J5726_04900 [Treponema sp.]|nr:hypothetical protein [Treponema sp.]
MKKAFTLIYSIIAALVLIFALSFLGYNLYQEQSHGDLRTQLRFDKMTSSIFTSMSKTNISHDELIRQIENAIGDKKDFAYIKITMSGKTLYLFPEDYDETQEKSKLVIYRNKSQSQNTISAGLYSLRPATIFQYTKIAFFIILFVALLTIILILYTNLSEKKKYYKVKKVHKVQKVRPHTDEEALEEEDEVEEETEEDEEEETWEEPEEEEVEAPAQVEEVKHEKEELPSHDIEPVELEEAQTDKGLFSPDTGFGWESYLMTRMDNELKRATASELDLALFVIKLKGVSRTADVMKKICEYLTVEFQFKDLLFEYKDDSVCALKISMNIDDAISLGEKLAEDIKKMFENDSAKVYIGISTRSIRIVSGERLLKEADEAVIHAMEDDDCPVVGFRADAVKYRKFIETK